MLLADARLPTGGSHPVRRAWSAAATLRRARRPAAARSSVRQPAGHGVRWSRPATARRCAPCIEAAAPVVPLGRRSTSTAWAARTPGAAMRDASRAARPRRCLRLRAPCRSGTCAALAGRRGLVPGRRARRDRGRGRAGRRQSWPGWSGRGRADGHRGRPEAAAVRPGRRRRAGASELRREVERAGRPRRRADRRPHDIPAYGAPQIEQWAEIHARTERRLFRA